MANVEYDNLVPRHQEWHYRCDDGVADAVSLMTVLTRPGPRDFMALPRRDIDWPQALDADLKGKRLGRLAAPGGEAWSTRMRNIRIAGAQLGPVQKADSRQAVVARMLDLMQQAKAAGCDLVVYPELALTTFFPRWYYQERGDADIWFEREMPGAATRPLFEEARRSAIAMSFGYAELTPDGHHFNTSILVDKAGAIIGKYRKVHLPGHAEYDPDRTHQHLEKRYFEPGDLGFPAWRMLGGIVGMCICNDRRWPETFRVLGLAGVELVTLGFNTPSVNSQRSAEGLARRMFHHRLTLQAGAYQNATFVVAVAKAGVEDGHHCMAGTMVVDPDGEIVAESATEDDELVVHDCDLDATRFGKETVFDFARHRRIEHYGPIASQAGVVQPPLPPA